MMGTRIQQYDGLATLLNYPGADYCGSVRRTRKQLAASCPPAGTRLARFEEHVQDLDIVAIEELFTRTFDLNPDCCPEIGWHLFGERYARGSMLVWMRAQLRALGVEETQELPDHIAHVLRALGRMEGEEASRFATEAVVPALECMAASLESKDNPYKDLLLATQELLVADHGAPAQTTVTDQAESLDAPGQSPGSGV